jgi:hypothetical protein
MALLPPGIPHTKNPGEAWSSSRTRSWEVSTRRESKRSWSVVVYPAL